MHGQFFYMKGSSLKNLFNFGQNFKHLHIHVHVFIYDRALNMCVHISREDYTVVKTSKPELAGTTSNLPACYRKQTFARVQTGK